MRIAYCSDLHIDSSNLKFVDGFVSRVRELRCEKLIIAGDLIECAMLIDEELPYYGDVDHKNQAIVFFKALASIQDLEVYWIFGNHEYYNCDINTAVERTKGFLVENNLHHVKILDNEIVDFGETQLIASTLWTNYNNQNPVVMESCRYGMNDFRRIRDGNLPITPIAIYNRHQESVTFIKNALSSGKNSIVVSHHFPLILNREGSTHSSDSSIIYAYGSNLEDLFHENPNVMFWVCGHTHEQREFNISTTKLLTNARGYEYYEPHLVDSFTLKAIDI